MFSHFREKQRDLLDYWAVPGYSILKTVPAIRDLNMPKLREFVHYRTKPVLELLSVCG